MRIQAGGRDEDEASTGAGGMSRAVRIVVRIQAGARRRATTSDDRRWWCEPGGEDRGEDTGEDRGGAMPLRCATSVATNSSHKQ